MRWGEREKALKKLDEEQRWFWTAAKNAPERKGWLREIRVALGISSMELAKKLGINRSEIYREEEREAGKRISLAVLERVAEAMDCRLVYAVVPKKGTLKAMLLRRALESLRGDDDEKLLKYLLRRGWLGGEE